MATEHRTTPRISKLSFISFVRREGDEQKCPISMGRTLNISTTGLGIEVFQEIPPGSTMELEIALGDDIIPVRGKVVHGSEAESGCWHLGIEFDQVQDKLTGVVCDPR